MRSRKNTPLSGLETDLVAIHFPEMAARQAAKRVTALASDIRSGRVTLLEARARLRGAA